MKCHKNSKIVKTSDMSQINSKILKTSDMSQIIFLEGIISLWIGMDNFLWNVTKILKL